MGMICYCSIEGLIGCGKSTIFESLRTDPTLTSRPDVLFVPEPVTLWQESGMLAAYYEGALSKAVFQLLALTTRFQLVHDAMQQRGIKMVISERSLYCDKHVFARLLLSHDDAIAYEISYAALMATLPGHFAWHIYLKLEPSLALERIGNRHRGEEKKISIEFLKDLALQHEHWLMKKKAASSVKIDASRTRPEVLKDVKETIISALQRAELFRDCE